MKYIFCLFLDLISLFICAIPNWKYDNIAIELTDSELQYTICTKELSGVTAVTKKKITRTSNSISYKNYISVDGGTEQEVGFECVESPYKGVLGTTYLVCPKSKYHPYDYTKKKYIKPTNNPFENGDDFEIKCYQHNNEGYFIVAYLVNGETNFYLTKDNGNNWDSNSVKIHNGIYDFELNYQMMGNNHEYGMVYLAKKDNKIDLIGTKLTLKSDYAGRADCSTKELVNAKSYSRGFIKSDVIYYLTYDTTSFYSGYTSTGVDYDDYNNVGSVSPNNNLNCPFDFIDEIKIEEMNFIGETQYVFYILTNQNTGKKKLWIN